MEKVQYWDVSAEDYENNNFGEKIVEYFDEGYTLDDMYNEAGIILKVLDNGDYTYENADGEVRFVRIAD